MSRFSLVPGGGLNVEQELGLPWLVAFFRLGLGDSDVTSIKRLASGGFGIEAPLGRDDDLLAFGVAWSKPSAPGTRDETILELLYRIQITHTLELTPDLQLILDPADNPGDDEVFIAGIRLTMLY